MTRALSLEDIYTLWEGVDGGGWRGRKRGRSVAKERSDERAKEAVRG